MKNGFTRRISMLCLVAAILIIPASTSFGDDFTTSIGAGAKSMLFTFSGLDVLGAEAFNGGLGAKYYVTDPLALRVSIPFSYANQNLPANAGTGFTGTDGYNSGVRVGLSAAVEYHFLKTRVSPYAGGGLGILYGSTTQKPAVVVANGAAITTSTTTDNSAAGVTIGTNAFTGGTTFNAGLLGGVEFFIVKELSLSAEYQFGYGLTAHSDQVVTTVTTTTAGTTTTSTTTKTTTKVGALSSFGISNTGALTLSVYF